MAIYIAAYLAMAGIAAFSYQYLNKEKASRFYILFFVLCWALILGLRHPSMGVDLDYVGGTGYWAGYTSLGKASLEACLRYRYQNYEKGYMLLNHFLYRICEDPQFLLMFCGGLSFLSVGVWIFRGSRHPFLSTVVYLGLPCFLINFSAMRQVIALAITLWSLDDIRKKRWIRFVLVIFLAGFFHSSALLFLFAYPLYHIRMGRPLALFSIGLPPAVWILRVPLFMLLTRIFKPNAEPDYNGAFTLFAVLYLVYVYTVVFADMDSGEESGFRNLFLVSVLLQALGGMHGSVLRVGYYYMIYAVLLIPSVVDNHLRKGSRYAKAEYAFMFMLVCACFVYQAFSQMQGSDWAQAVPYFLCFK